ncbi:MAG: glutamate racemase [Candidatus Electryoneaceae bacterium]|nr:glutamate racemase [Candidatus Electryoneaceae bacterium]
MIYPNDRPIGVFDSGIGGLTVAKALHNRLPGEDIIYLGDTARVPYGTKSVQAVRRYALECALFLLNQGVKLVVAACNTVSAVALDRLKELLRVPIIGVLKPGASAALQATSSKRIGVIGTPSTIESGAYRSRLIKLLPDVKVWEKACPLLVSLSEEGRLDGPIVQMVLEEYLAPLKEKQIDTLILGCTHYPLFRPAIGAVMGDDVTLVDSAETVATEVEDVILREGLLDTSGSGVVRCCVTDVPRQFDELGRMFFGEALTSVERVSIDE